MDICTQQLGGCVGLCTWGILNLPSRRNEFGQTTSQNCGLKVKKDFKMLSWVQKYYSLFCC